MNAVTIADIKRGGMAALDAALNAPQHGGVVTIMKRNRPAAIVLTPETYEALLTKATQTQSTNHALDWLLQMPEAAPGNVASLDEAQMAARLKELQAEWPAR